MTIEKKCNREILKRAGTIHKNEKIWSLYDKWEEIEFWTCDLSKSCSFDLEPDADLDSFTSNNIKSIIKKSDTTECLTSKSEYIRECKKWYMERE